MTAKPKKISSLELLLRGDIPPQAAAGTRPLHRGARCPRCGLADLDYNGLLELECPHCGFVNSDGGGCT